MKCSKSFIITVVALMIAGRFLWHRWNEMANAPLMGVSPEQDGALLYIRSHGRINATTNRPAPQPSTNKIPQNLGFREKANEMTDAEKVEMTNLFVTKLKPAVEKWALVYTNRVPFDLPDFTMDKFVERFGRDFKVYHSYTFVMGDITLGIAEQNGDTAVQYLASRSGLAVAEISNREQRGKAFIVLIPSSVMPVGLILHSFIHFGRHSIVLHTLVT